MKRIILKEMATMLLKSHILVQNRKRVKSDRPLVGVGLDARPVASVGPTAVSAALDDIVALKDTVEGRWK